MAEILRDRARFSPQSGLRLILRKAFSTGCADPFEGV